MTASQVEGALKLRYFCTVRATNFAPLDWKEKLVRVVLWFVPDANPDYDFPSIRKWYVEVDGSGQPIREVALDEDGSPLFGAPLRENFGFWVDSEGPLPDEGTHEIDEATFTDAWSTLLARHPE
jgi:hypothetical protein